MPSEPLAWKKTGERVGYQDPWIRVRVDEVIQPDGKPSTYAVVERQPAVGIVAVDDQNRLLLIKEFKYPIQKEVMLIPAGKVEATESPLEAAKRELREEGGIEADEWKQLCHFYPSAGMTNEEAYIFLAKNIRHLGERALEGTEMISEPFWMDVGEVYKQFDAGAYEDSYFLIGLGVARQHLWP